MTSDGRLIHAWDLTKYPATPEEDFWTDEDRAVIYESGLIDVNAEHDPNVWANEGWDNYQIPYSFDIPQEYSFNDEWYGYDPGYAEPVEVPAVQDYDYAEIPADDSFESAAVYEEPEYDLYEEPAGYYEEAGAEAGGYEEEPVYVEDTYEDAVNADYAVGEE